MPAYDEATAISGVHYTNAAFCNPANLHNWTCGKECDFHPKMQEVTTAGNYEKGSQGYAAYDAAKNLIVLAFRGTSDVRNDIADADFIPVKYPEADCGDCRVDMGFYDSYRTMYDTLIPAVGALAKAHPSAEILVTGHSLGAVQSQYGYISVVRGNFTTQKVNLYNYGSPRPGNKAFAEWGAAQFCDGCAHYRLTHAKDPVPHLPPQWIISYSHMPREVWYPNKSSGSYVVCDDSVSSEDNKCSNGILLPDQPNDHLFYANTPIGGCGG